MCTIYIRWCAAGLLCVWRNFFFFVWVGRKALEISLCAPDTFASPLCRTVFFFFMKILFGHLGRRKKHHHPYDLFFFFGWIIVGRSRLLSPVVNFSFFVFFLFFFLFYSINKQRRDAMLWLISILQHGQTRQIYTHIVVHVRPCPPAFLWDGLTDLI